MEGVKKMVAIKDDSNFDKISDEAIKHYMSSIFEYEAIIASVQKNYVEIEMMQQSLPFRSKAKTKKSKKIQRHRIQMRKNGR